MSDLFNVREKLILNELVTLSHLHLRMNRFDE